MISLDDSMQHNINNISSATSCILLFFLFLSCLLLPVPDTSAELIDRVVAEVNDEIITLSELEEEGLPFFRKIVTEVPQENRDAELANARNEILNGLIDKTLIAQEAAKLGITVSEEEIDTTFLQIINNGNTTRERFIEQLHENGIDETIYRDNLKSQIYQNKLVNREVRSKIIITEDMILDFYDTQYTQHVEEGGYYLLQIGSSWGESEAARKSTATLYEDKQAARKRAERVHKLARSGQDFRELAGKFSSLPSAADGGDIGIFQEDEMASYMKNAVTSLKPGEISAIIETPVGFQFFKLLSSREGGIVMQAPYESVKEEIRERLFMEKLQEDFEDWITELKDRAYIRTL